MKGRTPEIKAPKFLTDLYRDLRDQRLLPLVILLLIAIPVVPFVLRDPTPAFVPPADDEGLAATIADSTMMVVSAPPGLRRHGERFADRTPRDPFVDPNAPEPTPGREAGGTGATPGAPGGSGNDGGDDVPDLPTDPPITTPRPGDDPGTFVPPSPPSPPSPGDPGDSPGGSDPGRDGGSGSGKLRLFRLKTTIHFGKAGSGQLHTFADIDRMRGLPNTQPIAVFIGSADDASRAVFSITPDASLVSGQGKCSSGRPKNCQFLSLRPGQAANIHDARRGVIWRLGVGSIKVVASEMRVGKARSGNKTTGPDGANSRPVVEPVEPDPNPTTSLSEVIGLYLLK